MVPPLLNPSAVPVTLFKGGTRLQHTFAVESTQLTQIDPSTQGVTEGVLREFV